MLKWLRLKFVCINMFIVTSMLCVIFALTYQSTQSNLEAESLRLMQSIAENPFQQGKPGEPNRNVGLPYFVLEIGMRGELLAANSGYYDLSDEAFLKEVMYTALSSKEPSGVLEKYELRYLRVASMTSQCLVFTDMSGEQATLDDLLNTFLLIGVIGLLAFFGISLLLARWMVKPVDRAWTQQRQFVSDASHELKTPLTVIMTNAELLQDPDAEESRKQQLSDHILLMSQKMRGLVEGLLDLARVDNGTAVMKMEPLNLSQLAEDSTLPFEPLFYERGLSVCCRIYPQITVQGSAQHLRQVLEILLDNALKYALPDTTVYVDLGVRGTHCRLSVYSRGERISKEDLKNIFKRFYRVDKSRGNSGSYGLGLSIAEGIVQNHKGKIWAESDGNYNAFHVQLPTV